MKNAFFILFTMAFFFSCTNEKATDEKTTENDNKSASEVTTVDSLPDAKWNGEYMKIDSAEKKENKRKSRGSEFYSMGSVKLSIGDKAHDITVFERKKNGLTFTTESIQAFITSAYNENIKIRFNKQKIVTEHRVKYTADPTEQANQSFSMTINMGDQEKDQEYRMEKGTAEILDFSPRTGVLHVMFEGTFTDKDGNKQKGKGAIKMNFEGAVMTAG